MSIAFPRRIGSRETLASFGRSRLIPLCQALQLQGRQSEILDLFDRLVHPWGEQPVDRKLDWHSHVVDDGTPFEFSVAFGPRPELRIMVEPLAAEPTLKANGEAAVELLNDLARDYDITLDRFNRIADLFLTDDPQGAFSIWVATMFGPDGPPDFKLYLCPEARGPRIAPVTIEETMVRLGFPEAWGVLGGVMGRRGPEHDEFKYFSLDLKKSREARVKIYARHQRSTPMDVEKAAMACPAHHPGEVRRFLGKVAPGIELYLGRAPFTCYAFVEGKGPGPASVTTHFPINGYVDNDAEAAERIRDVLDDFGMDRTAYEAVLEASTDRGLHLGVGLQSYASYRRQHGEPRLTVYLPKEAYVPGTVADAGRQAPPSGVFQIVPRYESSDHLVYHPFVRRFEREPFNRGHMWTLLANLQISEEGRAQRLQSILSKASTEHLRQLVWRLLVEELGSDGVRSARIGAFRDLMDKISSWRPSNQAQLGLSPGRHLQKRLSALVLGKEPVEATGALVAEEVFRRQMSCFLREQLVSYSELDPSLHGWLTHIDDRFDPADALARCVPPGCVAALFYGSEQRAQAEWRFLNDIYSDCYGSSVAPTASPRVA